MAWLSNFWNSLKRFLGMQSDPPPETHAITGGVPLIPEAYHPSRLWKIDWDTFAKQLAPRDNGRRAGLKNEPAVEQQNYTEWENNAFKKVKDELRDRVEVANKVLGEGITGFRNYRPPVGDFTSEVEQLSYHNATLKDRIDQWKLHVEDLIGQFKDSVDRYKSFRKQHSLVERNPKHWEPEHRHRVLLWIAICAGLEFALNASLLAQSNAGGLPEVLLMTLVIAIVTIGCGTLTGLLWRRGNYKDPEDQTAPKKWRLLVAIPATVLVLFSFMIAHLRAVTLESQMQATTADQTTGVGWQVFDAGKLAILSMRTDLFGIDDAEGWAMLVGTLVLSLYVVYKFYAFDDPYPGYGELRREVQDIRDELDMALSATDAVLGTRRDRLDSASADCKNCIARCRKMQDELTVSFTRSQELHTLNNKFQENLEEYQNRCDSEDMVSNLFDLLLLPYREENQMYRTSTVPTYFSGSQKDDEKKEELLKITIKEATVPDSLLEDWLIDPEVTALSNNQAESNDRFEREIVNFEELKDSEVGAKSDYRERYRKELATLNGQPH